MRSAALNTTMVGPLLLAAALALPGCWTAPVANVQPKGEARLIQGAIVVESVKPRAIVQSVDRSSDIIVLGNGGAAGTSTYKVGARVANISRIKPGDTVKATVAQELTVYVLRDGEAPGPNGAPQKIAADARVLSVDPSYRLLTLQYANGQKETFKVGQQIRLDEMEAGDAVVIRPIEVLALR